MVEKGHASVEGQIRRGRLLNISIRNKFLEKAPEGQKQNVSTFIQCNPIVLSLLLRKKMNSKLFGYNTLFQRHLCFRAKR